MRRGARSVRGRDGPAPTPCVQAQCFDPLVRLCVACRLFRTPEPGRGKGRPPQLASGTRGGAGGGSRRRAPHPARPGATRRGPRGTSAHREALTAPLSPAPCAPASPPSGLRSLPSFPRPLSPSPPHAPAAGLSSQAPGTALQPQESVGAGAAAVLPLPGLLFGAPALLGLALALALALVALMSWRWQRRRRTASLEAPDGGQDGESHVWEKGRYRPMERVTWAGVGPVSGGHGPWEQRRCEPVDSTVTGVPD